MDGTFLGFLDVRHQASTLVSEGYLAALVRDLRDLPAYWEGMLKDFPGHPAKDNDPQLRASIGCTLYGCLDRNPVLVLCFLVVFNLAPISIGVLSVPKKTMFRKLGDEIDCLNDSWMFLLWSSDTSPVLSHSPSSRWPICIVPASRYVYENGVNITIQALTHAIANSFNRLSNFGIPVRDLASLGGGLVPLMSIGAICFPLEHVHASKQDVRAWNRMCVRD